jgi:outer membrane protein assembly factor BamB
MKLPCTRSRLWLSVFVAAAIAQAAQAENWPQWRGPRFNGTSSETGLPEKLSAEDNLLWRARLPGPAGSTPIIWGERIFLTSVDSNGQDLLLVCLDTSGKELWRQTLDRGNRNVRGDEGNSASNSPATDGQHVWAMVTTGAIGCYDFQGLEVWKFNLQQRYGRFNIDYGMTSTPLLHGERLYVQLIHGDGNAKTREAIVVALDKATGRELWKVERPSDAYAECEHSYASPTIYQDEQRQFLLSHGADYVVAHDLADGHEVWRCGQLNLASRYNPTLRFVASPAAVPGLIIVPSAKNGPVLALGPAGKGDISTSQQDRLWTLPDNTPDVPSPVIHDGLVYLCRENGNLICLDTQTGEKYYDERTHRMRHRSSPVYADGKLYLCARDGTITVVKAGRQFELLSQTRLTGTNAQGQPTGDDISASPAVAGGRIYIRSYKALFAFGSK